MTTIKCPNTLCPAVCRVPDEFVGKKVVCRKCGTKFLLAVNGYAAQQNSAGTAVSKAVPPPLPAGYAETSPKEEPLPLPEEEPLSLSEEGDDEEQPHGSGRRRFLVVSALVAAMLVTAVCVVGIVYWVKSSSPHEVYGGIEITSSEVRVSAYEFFPDSNLGFDFKRVSDSPWSEKIQWKKPDTGDFDPDAQKEVVATIARLHKQLQQKHNLCAFTSPDQAARRPSA